MNKSVCNFHRYKFIPHYFLSIPSRNTKNLPLPNYPTPTRWISIENKKSIAFRSKHLTQGRIIFQRPTADLVDDRTKIWSLIISPKQQRRQSDDNTSSLSIHINGSRAEVKTPHCPTALRTTICYRGLLWLTSPTLPRPVAWAFFEKTVDEWSSADENRIFIVSINGNDISGCASCGELRLGIRFGTDAVD